LALPLEANLGSALDLSEVVVASLPAPSGALVLASRLRAALALLNGANDVSDAAVVLLLAPSSALVLASWNRRDLAL